MTTYYWRIFFLILIYCVQASLEAQRQTENVFIITVDGLRWQELFGGADSILLADKSYVKDSAALHNRYWDRDASVRRKKLMPWMWDILSNHGQILGNQWLGNRGFTSNMHWFSYPGYNELLSGYSDPYVNSNDKKPNPNVTVLEWLHHHAALDGKVAAFASWDVFPYIINVERSGVPVNAGFDTASGEFLTEREKYLNTLQAQTFSPWGSVRLDVFTHQYTIEYLKRARPRVCFVGYGEVDDFAHDHRYDHYLNAINRTDNFIRDLWDYCQSDPFYKDKTSFVITTDHGRGDKIKSEWTGHGKIYEGSNQVWIAVLGPDTYALGERSDNMTFTLSQTAATVAALLGYDLSSYKEVAPVLEGVFKE